MTPAEREAVAQAMAVFLSSKTELQADAVLASAGAPETPGGWGTLSVPMKRRKIRELLAHVEDDEILEYLKELLPEDQRQQSTGESSALPEIETARSTDGPIFVVHGHARAALHEAVRVLERGTGREVVVLHEQANAGRTILEKFEDHAADASFAVVLLTGDDEGGIRAGSGVRLRGRQNVIFELGFFFGKLGRNRVAVLLEEEVEKPSDIDGLVYIIHDDAGAWKQTLARELEAAGISVDRSRIP